MVPKPGVEGAFLTCDSHHDAHASEVTHSTASAPLHPYMHTETAETGNAAGVVWGGPGRPDAK